MAVISHHRGHRKAGCDTKCKECGKQSRRSFSGLCRACYEYFKNGGQVYPLPPPGRVERDPDGKVICHICGRSYKRLGSHVHESHNMTIDEYKEKFGLCRRARTTEENYSQTMRDYFHKSGLDGILSEAGKATRVKKGENALRKGKPARLQECLDKRNRGSP